MQLTDLSLTPSVSFVFDAALVALIGLVSWVELEGWMSHATVAVVLLTAILRLLFMIRDRARGKKEHEIE